MTAFIASLIFVVLAEMGDKTQLLGMAFATRFRWQTVMWGVFVATAANQYSWPPAAGSYLTMIVPLGIIKVAAAISFILFGLWIIRGDQLAERFGGVLVQHFLDCDGASLWPRWRQNPVGHHFSGGGIQRCDQRLDGDDPGA